MKLLLILFLVRLYARIITVRQERTFKRKRYHHCGICNGLWMNFVYALYERCIYGLFLYFVLCGIYDFRKGLSCELRLA